MKTIVALALLLAACAHAPTAAQITATLQPCLEQPVPPIAKLEMLEEPTPVTDDQGNDGITMTFTPESGLGFFKYVTKLREIAERASRCFQK